MAKLDFPSSPTAGQIYAAPNGVTYTWDDTIGVGVWTAKVTALLSLTSVGSISGTAQVGETLTYTVGSATGGVAPYTYSWEWRLTSDNSVLQTDGSTLVVPAAAVGDTIYIFLTATDAATSTATGSTSVYPTGGATIVNGPFPNLPAGLLTGPTAVPGTASGTWADGTTTVTSTGCLQISLDNVTFGTGPLSINNGDTLYERWDPTGASCGGAADGTTITGTLEDGTYVQSYSLLIDRSPAAFTINDLTGQALSSVATSNSITLSGTTAPTYITYTAGATTLTSVQVSIDGGAYTAVPTSGTTLSADPGASLQFQGTVGAANSTAYTATINLGSTSDEWSVTTTAVTPTIQTPSITSPADGSTDINPAVNSPAGVSLVADTYTPLNGAGATQTSSTWEVYKGGYPLVSTNSITSVGTVTTSFPLPFDAKFWYYPNPGNDQPTQNWSDTPSFNAGSGTFTAAAQTMGAAGMSCTPDNDYRIAIIRFSSVVTIEWRLTDSFYNIDTSLDGTNWTVNRGLSLSGTFTGQYFRLLYANAINWCTDMWIVSTGSQTTLAIAGCQTDGFLVGDIIDDCGGGAGPVTITSLDDTQVTFAPQDAGFAIGENICRDTSSYTAVTGSPFTVSSAPFTTIDIAQADLNPSSTYYARVQYDTTNATAATSEFSAWSSFATASSFAIEVGAAYGGGYYAGQINDGGTIYNLIVAPAEGDVTGPAVGGSLQGQYGGATVTGIGYKTGNSADSPTATAQNEVYGAGATTTFADGSHPLFDWCVSSATGPNAGTYDATNAAGTGIGGYNDWYIPAKDEAAVLYFFLKPDTTANFASSGSNPNSVSPYTPNTNFSAGFPGQTTNTLFQTGGSEAFSTAVYYWTSTEYATATGNSRFQFFRDGTQNYNVKTTNAYARAIRRVPA